MRAGTAVATVLGLEEAAGTPPFAVRIGKEVVAKVARGDVIACAGSAVDIVCMLSMDVVISDIALRMSVGMGRTESMVCL